MDRNNLHASVISSVAAAGLLIGPPLLALPQSSQDAHVTAAEPLQIAPLPSAEPIPEGALPQGPLPVPLANLPPVSPPPGTLGMTYQRPSRPIPAEKHPRVGMLEIHVAPELTADPDARIKPKISVQDWRVNLEELEGFYGDDQLYHFESDPLIPGIPHIYHIKLDLIRIETSVERKWGRLIEREKEIVIRTVGYRTVRLIPGRIIELEW